uniref:MmyB family transcriptional regulator n=1 Tax=Streptomyces canus TaxID=58343 RepID=UPI0027D92CFE|nr:hypothetical protein [Streptomyces canus]
MATTDPARLPEKATWYLATNLPHPDAPHVGTGSHPPADLAEIVRLYGLRPWIERSYKQIKDELGWADFQVRCAFSFCWDQWFTPPGPLDGVHESLTKTVRHASVGEFTLDCDILAALGTDLRIMAFSAAEGSETAERLRLLDVVGVQALTGTGTDT